LRRKRQKNQRPCQRHRRSKKLIGGPGSRKKRERGRGLHGFFHRQALRLMPNCRRTSRHARLRGCATRSNVPAHPASWLALLADAEMMPGHGPCHSASWQARRDSEWRLIDLVQRPEALALPARCAFQRTVVRLGSSGAAKPLGHGRLQGRSAADLASGPVSSNRGRWLSVARAAHIGDAADARLVPGRGLSRP